MSSMNEPHCPVCGAEKFRHRCSGHAVAVEVMPNCDLCSQEGNTVKAVYDGKTRMGPWAYMCEDHYQRFGFGLGTGSGQMLVAR